MSDLHPSQHVSRKTNTSSPWPVWCWPLYGGASSFVSEASKQNSLVTQDVYITKPIGGPFRTRYDWQLLTPMVGRMKNSCHQAATLSHTPKWPFFFCLNPPCHRHSLSSLCFFWFPLVLPEWSCNKTDRCSLEDGLIDNKKSFIKLHLRWLMVTRKQYLNCISNF